MKTSTIMDLNYRKVEMKHLEKGDLDVLSPYINEVDKVVAYYKPFEDDEIIQGISAKNMARMKEGLIISVRVHLKNGYQMIVSQELFGGGNISLAMDTLEVSDFQYIVADKENNFVTDNNYGSSVSDALEEMYNQIKTLSQ